MRDETRIMHAETNISGSMIMLADATDVYAPMPAGFFIYVENADETYRKALAEGATAVSELQDRCCLQSLDL